MKRAIRCFLPVPVLAVVASLVAAGCRSQKTQEDSGGPKISEIKPLEPTKPEANPVAALREMLKLNPEEGRIELDPRGRIVEVELDRTRVTDLSPLSGLPIEKLYLRQTNVSDLSPLKDMPLKFLNLLETRVSDISVVKTLDLNTLWLNDTKVKDLSPLKGESLESLDLTGTPVTDLSPISGMKSLRRLNLERCAVTDLTPLEGLQLQRIVFHPAKITKGLDVVRNMKSLVHMHSTFQDDGKWLPPDEFWKQAAAGTLPKQ